ATPLRAELAATGEAVLGLGRDREPTRRVAGRLPSFGDDDVAPVPTAAARLGRLADDLRTGSPDVVTAAVAQLAGSGVALPVQALPPDVAIRVSGGVEGRLLVLAAENEPGWHATVDGHQVPVSRAWGHLVAVTLPAQAVDVRVDQSAALRSVLLLVQVAALL